MSIGLRETAAAIKERLDQLKQAINAGDPSMLDQALTQMAYIVRKVRVNAPGMLEERRYMGDLVAAAAEVAFVDLSEDDDGSVEKQWLTDVAALERMLERLIPQLS